jgi:hypothetical protein
LYGVKTGGRGAGFKVKEMEKRSNGRERHARTWIMETGGKGKEWRRVEEEVERRGDGRTGERENGRTGEREMDGEMSRRRSHVISSLPPTTVTAGGDSTPMTEEKREGREERKGK